MHSNTSMVGKFVLVRDHMAGVLFGRLEELDLGQKTWVLTNARKIHFWSKAAAVEGVVVRGPDPAKSRVTPAVTQVAGAALVQVIVCTSAEEKVLSALPEWKP